jgi:flavodoxin
VTTVEKMNGSYPSHNAKTYGATPVSSEEKAKMLCSEGPDVNVVDLKEENVKSVSGHRRASMKVLVAYMSQTGNTKKVAEAIFDVIPEPKEIKRVQDVKSLEGYDLTFLGFPIQGSGPNKQAKSYLGKLTKGKTIALFITHAAPENASEMPDSIQKFRDAATEAKIIGVFDCQGQLSGMVKTFMRFSPDRQLREWARIDNSKGQPDAARLERAIAFAHEVMNVHS